jgi:hypothetical protein
MRKTFGRASYRPRRIWPPWKKTDKRRTPDYGVSRRA